MTEQTQEVEVKLETPPNTEEEQSTQESVKESPIEVAARSSGWVTKDEWIAQGKDPNEWRSAREYQERGELFEEIHRLKEDTRKVTKAFKALAEHYKNVRETSIKEAIEQLKAQKRVALENNDVSAVFEIDERIEQVREQKADVPEVDVSAEVTPTPTFRQWHKRNNWYELDGDDEASRYADMVGMKYRKSNPEATEREILDEVESKVAKRFPEKFDTKPTNRTAEVNPRSDTRSVSGDTFKLTDEEEEAFKTFVKMGAPIDRKQYVAEIKKMRGH